MKISPIIYNHISYNKMQPRFNPAFGCSDCDNNAYTDKAFDASKKILAEMINRTLPVREMGKICGVETKIMLPFISLTSACIDFKINFNTGRITNPPVIMTPMLEREDKIGKTVYVMNFVHELTHKYQIEDREDALSQLMKDTLDAGFKLREIGDDFVRFSNYHNQKIEGDLMRKVVWTLLGEEGEESYKKTGGLVLTNAVVNKTEIANALDYRNEEDFIKNFARENVPFDEIVETICTRNPILAAKCVDSPSQVKGKIKKILIKYFRNSSKMEKEARLVENKVATLQGFDDKSSKCISLYFSMLEKAFDYYLNNYS